MQDLFFERPILNSPYEYPARHWELDEGHNLGSLLVEAQGAPPDDPAGGRSLRQAADHAHPLAMAWLGATLYDARWKGERSPEGIAWLRRAAAIEEPTALYSLGHATLYGRAGVPRDLARARDLFARSAAGGDARSRPVLWWLDRLDPALVATASDSTDLMVRAVFAGHEWALQTLLGWAGQGAAEADRAFARFAPAETAGPPAAQTALGEAYLNGLGGLDEDPIRGLHLIRAAAQAGSPHAMRTLGSTLRHGHHGVPKNPTEGMRWLLQGAEAGDSIAMLWAGRALLYEGDAPKDPPRGLALLERAAAEANHYAVEELAWLYDTGYPPVEADPAKARRWYEEAAAMGDQEARGWLVVWGGGAGE